MMLEKANRRQLIKSAALLPLAAHSGSVPGVRTGLVESSIALPLAVAIPDTDVPADVSNILTAGYARAGIGAARYLRITGEVARKEQVLQSRNGTLFRLAEPVPTIDMFGANAAAADNSVAIQSAIDHASSAGGGLVFVPPGRYRFGKTIQMAAGVHLTGAGTFASELVFHGDGVAVDAVGNASARKLCRMSDFSLRAANAGNTATAVQLGWNQRSGPILAAVRIVGFGRYGVEFAASNWLVTLRDVEISRCGRNVAGGCGVFRGRGAEPLADIRLEGLIVEECGSSQSSGGGITFERNVSSPCQGLWVADSTIEGNFGQAEMSFATIDHLSLSRLYVETGDSDGNARDALVTQDCNVAIGNCRFGSAPGKKGRALTARGQGRVSFLANVWDADFADPAVMMDATMVEVGSSEELTNVTKGVWVRR